MRVLGRLLQLSAVCALARVAYLALRLGTAPLPQAGAM